MSLPAPTADRVAPPAAGRTSSPWLRRVVLVNLVFQVLIVVTGGVVRLTGSGLGCSTWPSCEPGEYTPTFHPEQGIHPYIEYGNRMLGVVVGIVAVITVAAVFRWAAHRPPMRALAVVVLAGTGFQGLLGGITVRTGLHPATVMAHFLVSMVLVAAATWLVWREREPDGTPHPVLPRLGRRVAWLTAAVGAVVLTLGTVVTGSGPHSGDAQDPARFGFDPRTIAWLHADSVMLFCGLVIAMVLATHLVSSSPGSRSAWRAVLLVTLAQGAIGYTQYATGLPELLVLVHMLGAALLVVTLTCGLLSLHSREDSRPEPA